MYTSSTNTESSKYFALTQQIPYLIDKAIDTETSFREITLNTNFQKINVQQVRKLANSIGELAKARGNEFPDYLAPHLPSYSEALGQLVRFCLGKKLVKDLSTIFLLIKECFKQEKSIAVNYIQDPEISNYSQICFTLTLQDTLENILITEEFYYKKLIKLVSPENRCFFVLDYVLL
ncbi:MAG: hypothetical protein HZA78_10550 [Candidatus Schekmanbacteria bacterium]|nr:hypothetical protein [Candidatus Schekmanbacteria bacterium]